jgi:hypothetical protein
MISDPRIEADSQYRSERAHYGDAGPGQADYLHRLRCALTEVDQQETAYRATLPVLPWTISVTRSEIVTLDFVVEARNAEEAQALAFQMAYDAEWPRSGNPEYSVDAQPTF